MLKVKDFKSKGYTAKETLHDITILKKNITDSEGLCYTIKVFVEDGYSIEPEVKFNTDIQSTVFLKVDDITTIDEIEEFFSSIWVSLGKPR